MACGSIAEKCMASDVNVIFFNREPLGDVMTSGKQYYVGTDADNEGQKQAHMAALLFGTFKGSAHDKNGDGIVQVAVLKGEQGHQDAEKRTENCISQLRSLGFEVEVLSIEAGNWSRDSGYKAMKKLYAEHNDRIELLFANNDDMAAGAIMYLEETGIFRENQNTYDQPFILIGVDGTTVGLDAIKRGFMYGTVLNDSAKQAEAVMTLAEYMLNKRDMSDFPYEIVNDCYIFLDGDIITMENLEEYL
jgi:methyl-galactoside transport system substrate-binding protein